MNYYGHSHYICQAVKDYENECQRNIKKRQFQY